MLNSDKMEAVLRWAPEIWPVPDGQSSDSVKLFRVLCLEIGFPWALMVVAMAGCVAFHLFCHGVEKSYGVELIHGSWLSLTDPCPQTDSRSHSF